MEYKYKDLEMRVNIFKKEHGEKFYIKEVFDTYVEIASLKNMKIFKVDHDIVSNFSLDNNYEVITLKFIYIWNDLGKEVVKSMFDYIRKDLNILNKHYTTEIDLNKDLRYNVDMFLKTTKEDKEISVPGLNISELII